MTHRRLHAALLFLTVNAVTGGCGPSLPPLPETKPAAQTRSTHLAALSQYSASLGTPIRGYGSGFPASLDDGHLQLIFNGEFQRDDGYKTDVHTAVEVRVLSGEELVWDQLGPYGHPFTKRGDEPGTFRGTVGARLITPENQPIEDPSPIHVTFTVEPSVVVRNFSPVTASCDGPVRRAFGALPYNLSVQAIGFMPRSATYIVSAKDAGFGDTTLTHSPLSSTTDLVSILPPPVPETVPAYTLAVRILMTDVTNRVFQTTFAIGVHQPIEIVYNLRPEIAEIYAPEVVSGCMQGGLSGRIVTYSEAMSQTLTRGTTLNWNRNWIESHSVSMSASRSTTEGFSVTTGHSVTDTHSDSNTQGWKLSNGFSVTSTDGKSGSWKVEGSKGTDSSHTTSMGESMTMATGWSLNPQSGILLGPAFTPARDPVTGNFTNTGVGNWKSSIFLSPTFAAMSGSGSGSASDHTDTSSQSANQSQTVGAGASMSKKIFSNTSLDGSETTTDLHSFTSSESETQKASKTQGMSASASDMTQSSMGMGMSSNDTVSSSDAIDRSFRGVILANQFAVFYRQTTRLAVQGSIIAYDQCGAGEVVGQASGTTYTWAPDLAQGPHCKPLPTSALPPYQCLISPCTRVPQ